MRFIYFALMSGFLTLSGCSFAPHVQAPETVAEIPESFVYADDETADEYAPLAWWASFEDPVLNRLIDSTLTSNLDLIEAVARVAEVRAQYRIERSDMFPGLQARQMALLPTSRPTLA